MYTNASGSCQESQHLTQTTERDKLGHHKSNPGDSDYPLENSLQHSLQGARCFNF